MFLLQRSGRVSDHSAVFLHLVDLGDGKPRVKHVLVVANEGCVATELVIEAVLCVRENVLFIFSCGRMATATIRRSTLLVLAQIWVKCTLTMSWSVLGAQATRITRDVRVTASAIVCVNDRLRVDQCQVVAGSLLRESKCAYKSLFGSLKSVINITFALSIDR